MGAFHLNVDCGYQTELFFHQEALIEGCVAVVDFCVGHIATSRTEPSTSRTGPRPTADNAPSFGGISLPCTAYLYSAFIGASSDTQ